MQLLLFIADFPMSDVIIFCLGRTILQILKLFLCLRSFRNDVLVTVIRYILMQSYRLYKSRVSAIHFNMKFYFTYGQV